MPRALPEGEATTHARPVSQRHCKKVRADDFHGTLLLELADLLLTLGPTPSTPDEGHRLLALACRGGGEQTHDPMLRQHRLGGALQRCLLGDLAFATSHGRS